MFCIYLWGGAPVLNNVWLLVSTGFVVPHACQVGPITTRKGLGHSLPGLTHQALEIQFPRFSESARGKTLVRRLPESTNRIADWLRQEEAREEARGGWRRPAARKVGCMHVGNS
mmetsp:Transcript_26089/g.49551  ORF Transcript_26089/g.49551 Transcript_26089/m.49551 type:complete len:114 (+) Transcript_26089:375-716(+)